VSLHPASAFGAERPPQTLPHSEEKELTTAACPATSESFDNIYLDLSKESGKCRFAETGFGWKPAGGGDTFTLDHSNIGSAAWSRAAKGYEVRILQRNSSGIIQLDGFQQEDYERLAKVFKNWYSTALENKEHALRGWNWGKAEFSKAELTFSVQNRPAFEVPYSEIGNTNLAGRNEVAVEMSLPQSNDDTGTNGHLGGARGKGKKAGAGKDQLVEMRFYIPGTTTKKETDGEDAGSDAGADNETNAATLFYDTLIEKAEIGETAGDAVATFLDVLHLTPRCVFNSTNSSFLMYTVANASMLVSTEAASISTCMTRRSVSAARRTITRSSTRPSRSSWCSQSPMRCTACS
jgi:structure-specific recognition protein 1